MMSGVSSTKGKSAALAKTDLVEPFAHRTVMKRPVLSASGEDEAMKNVNLPKEGAPTNAKGRLNEGDLEKALQSADLLQCDDVTPLKDGTVHQIGEGSRLNGVLNPQTEGPAPRKSNHVLWTDGPVPQTDVLRLPPIGVLNPPKGPNDLSDEGLRNVGAPQKENAHLNAGALPRDKDHRKQDALLKDKRRQRGDAPSRDNGRRCEDGAEKKDKVRTHGPT
jgi:hypothetical protein